MRWLRYAADGRESYGIIEGDDRALERDSAGILRAEWTHPDGRLRLLANVSGEAAPRPVRHNFCISR